MEIEIAFPINRSICNWLHVVVNYRFGEFGVSIWKDKPR